MTRTNRGSTSKSFRNSQEFHGFNSRRLHQFTFIEVRAGSPSPLPFRSLAPRCWPLHLRPRKTLHQRTRTKSRAIGRLLWGVLRMIAANSLERLESKSMLVALPRRRERTRLPRRRPCACQSKHSKPVGLVGLLRVDPAEHDVLCGLRDMLDQALSGRCPRGLEPGRVRSTRHTLPPTLASYRHATA
jgi:hypothetical protein